MGDSGNVCLTAHHCSITAPPACTPLSAQAQALHSVMGGPQSLEGRHHLWPGKMPHAWPVLPPPTSPAHTGLCRTRVQSKAVS